jgi:HEAT repeat protein
MAHYLYMAGDLNTPALALKYLNDPDKLKRVQACVALGLLKDKSTLPNLLLLLKKEEDPQVRQNAVKSLGLVADEEALPVLQTVSYLTCNF